LKEKNVKLSKTEIMLK